MSKKSQAVWVVVQHSVGSFAASAVPTPTQEGPKNIALRANDIAMCVRVASIHSGKELSKDGVTALLKEAGIAVGAGAGLSVAAGVIGHTAVNEMLNFVPVVGWGIKGVLASSLCGSIGFVFIKFCEERFGS
jgi:uncharacterized protein (DUF697 family)